MTLKEEQIRRGLREPERLRCHAAHPGLTPRPTAVFAFDDPMAIGAICAAWEAGVKVPDDISMIGL